jgi:5-methylcytosine-specific restriction endonuclease McrBC regulatory subunit McrC
LLAPDHEAIQRLAHDGIIELDLRGNEAKLSGVDRVGLVSLPSGRRLVIKSKIEGIVLLEWLAYLGEFPPLEMWVADSGVTTGSDFHACLARLFLAELDLVTRQHVRKDYTPVISWEATIRGRIISTRMYRKLNRLPRIPQSHRSRTFDTPYNIVLALALDKLPILLAREYRDDWTLLARLRDMWTHVRRDISDPVSAVTEAQWACPPGYRAALQLARLILIGAALDPESGLGGQAFTLSLQSVWERGLRRMVEQIGGITGWISVPDSARTRQWDDSSTRWLTADVMTKNNNELRWVLDAKYKRSFGNESRADRFQMCAYALAFDADYVSLAYPLAHSHYQQRTLLEAVVGVKTVTVDSINLPMSEGPASCKVALINMCKEIRSREEDVVVA